MRRLLPLLLLTMAATPPPVADDIVVTGRVQDAEAARREARAFVREVSPTPVDGQFARWHRTVCPAAAGLPPALAVRVVARIRQVAEEARIPLAPAGCKANAIVVFTPDATRFLTDLERREPRLLASTPLAERPALRNGDAAIRWWYTTLAEGADGNQLSDMPSVAFGPIGSSGPAIPFSDRTRSSDSYRSSIISTGLRSTITAAVALVDVPRTTGRLLDSVTDYAAFVLLAHARPSPPQGTTASILTLFSADEATRPKTLTTADRAYLAALYATPADRAARTQARAIAGSIMRDGTR